MILESQLTDEQSFSVDKESLIGTIDVDKCAEILSVWVEEEERELSIYKVTNGVGEKDPVYARVITRKTVEEGDFVEEEEVTIIGEGITIYGDVQPMDGSLNIFDTNEVEIPSSEERVIAKQVTLACLDYYEERVTGQTKEYNVDCASVERGVEIIVEVPVKKVKDRFNQRFEQYVTDYYNEEKVREYYKNMDLTFREILNKMFKVDGEVVRISGHPDVSSLLPKWRINTIALQNRGILKNQSLVAAVKSMQEYGEFTTQKEMSDELGIDKGNISRVVQKVEEWDKRMKWSCKNW